VQKEDVMRAYLLYLPVAWLVCCPLSAQAADLTKIERVIAKEPKYQGKPTYCLLVFGPAADFRVWLVLDGTTLYVDRNGNGDLTEPDKRVSPYYNQGEKFGFRPGKLGPPDDKAKYDLSQVRRHQTGNLDMSLPAANHYTRAGYDGPGPLRFADRPQDAPIIHFFGPLTLGRFDPQPYSASPHLEPGPLVRGEQNQLAFSLGTPGVGPGTFAKYPHPDELRASAEVRLPGGKLVTAALAPDL
jgi:hypothetical protein